VATTRVPANDPNQTTVHFSASAVPPNGLEGYDRIVYDRVRSLAGPAGMVPLTALARWSRRILHVTVVHPGGARPGDATRADRKSGTGRSSR